MIGEAENVQDALFYVLSLFFRFNKIYRKLFVLTGNIKNNASLLIISWTKGIMLKYTSEFLAIVLPSESVIDEFLVRVGNSIVDGCVDLRESLG